MRTVVIKTWDMMEEELGLNAGGQINCSPHYTHMMEDDMPSHRHIEVNDNNVWDGRRSRWVVSEDAILCDAFKPGEEIEVSNNRTDWVIESFEGIRFGSKNPILADKHNYKYARKRQEIESVVDDIKALIEKATDVMADLTSAINKARLNIREEQ